MMRPSKLAPVVIALGGLGLAVVVLLWIVPRAPRLEPVPTNAGSDAAVNPATPDRTPSTEAADTTEELVDLLHHSRCSIAVSSEVGNRTDLPAHLVDGRADTAWQGKTGDLVGAWIAFRVPADTRVRRIGIVAGYDSTSSHYGDLFEANVRIVRIVVRRDGAVIAEWRLDPDARAMQYLDTDLAGGDFKLEVAEVKTGTHKDWREVCVSELVVLGTGEVETDAHTPLVDVGGLGLREGFPQVAAGPFRDEVALCARAFGQTVPDDFPVVAFGADDTGACLPKETLRAIVGASSFLELRAVTGACANGLALRTPHAWFQLPVEFGRPQCGDTHYAVDAEVASATETDGILRVIARFADHTHHAFDEHGFETDEPTMVFTERTLVCRHAGTNLRCVTLETGTAPSRVNGTIGGASWVRTKQVEVRKDGTLSVNDLATL